MKICLMAIKSITKTYMMNVSSQNFKLIFKMILKSSRCISVEEMKMRLETPFSEEIIILSLNNKNLSRIHLVPFQPQIIPQSFRNSQSEMLRAVQRRIISGFLFFPLRSYIPSEIPNLESKYTPNACLNK
jgi:hypothetical protein